MLPLLLAVLLVAGCGSAPANPGGGAAPPEASGAQAAGASETKRAQAGLEPAALTGAAGSAPAAAAAPPADPAVAPPADPAPGSAAAAPATAQPAAAGPAGEFAPTIAGAGGHTLPRCIGWIWEGSFAEDGARQLDVTVLTLPGQPIFPTVACWAQEGVTPPDPAIRVLQIDGLQIHAAKHEHYSHKDSRHLWIFSIDAPPFPGFYFIRYQVDGVEWVTIPFEVGTPPPAAIPGS